MNSILIGISNFEILLSIQSNMEFNLFSARIYVLSEEFNLEESRLKK